MKITVNLDTQAVITQPSPLRFKAGCFNPVEVVFTRSSQSVSLPDGAVIEFALKPRNQWTGGLLAYLNEFTVGTGNLYTGTLNCASTVLLGALGRTDNLSANDMAQIDASAEVTSSFGGQKFRSTTFPATVEAPLTDDNPVATPDPELYPLPSQIALKSDLAELGGSDITAANQGEVDAGTDATKAVTPATFANAAKWATAGSGWASISTPRIAYIEAVGDDSTAELGNPSKPFLTAQAVFAAAFAGIGNCLLKFGIGDWSITSASGDWPNRIAIIGPGRSMATLSIKMADGANGQDGSAGQDEQGFSDPDWGGDWHMTSAPTDGEAGQNGSNGLSIDLVDVGNKSIAMTISPGRGGQGGQGGNCGTYSTGHPNGGSGGSGGNGGSVALRGCFVAGSVVPGGGGNGGTGGTGAYGQNYGSPGNAGNLSLVDCEIQGEVRPVDRASNNNGDFGSGSTVTIDSCRIHTLSDASSYLATITYFNCILDSLVQNANSTTWHDIGVNGSDAMAYGGENPSTNRFTPHS